MSPSATAQQIPMPAASRGLPPSHVPTRAPIATVNTAQPIAATAMRGTKRMRGKLVAPAHRLTATRPIPGRAAGRRAALAPGADHGAVVGREPRPARRAEPVLLRGPDRDRRRAARGLPGGGRPDGVAVGLVPHYVAAAPNPKAALALVRKLEAWSASRSTPASSRRRGRLRAPGLARRPERPRRAGLRRAPRAGRRGGGAEDDPAGPALRRLIAREFQRFLRQRGPEAGGDPR